MDRELIDFWERELRLSSEDSARRLELVEAEVNELEKKLREAPDEDKYQLRR